MTETAKILKTYRISQKLTQNEFAKKIKFSVSSLRKWEIGNRQPKLKTILKIIQKTEIEADEIIKAYIKDTKNR